MLKYMILWKHTLMSKYTRFNDVKVIIYRLERSWKVLFHGKIFEKIGWILTSDNKKTSLHF